MKKGYKMAGIFWFLVLISLLCFAFVVLRYVDHVKKRTDLLIEKFAVYHETNSKLYTAQGHWIDDLNEALNAFIKEHNEFKQTTETACNAYERDIAEIKNKVDKWLNTYDKKLQRLGLGEEK